MPMRSEVILVHGLWIGSWAMARLAKNLEAAGYSVRRFAYPTTRQPLAGHAQALAEFARTTRAAQLHFVSHSLGGLVTLKMLNTVEVTTGRALPQGRVVLLGSPLVGSDTARRSGRVPGSAKLFGQIRSTLEQGYPHLDGRRETGMIAGSKAVGLGRLVGGAEKPSDGTVAVKETRVERLTDHLTLPVTHTGMLFSAEVARQTAHFLETGGFEHAPA